MVRVYVVVYPEALKAAMVAWWSIVDIQKFWKQPLITFLGVVVSLIKG